VDAKTNEIPYMRTVLDQIPDLQDVLVTADALCRCRHKASYADLCVMPTSPSGSFDGAGIGGDGAA